jgi:epoxyqueuosine reductase
MFSAKSLKDQAAAQGFNLVGIAPAAPSPRLDAYLAWVEQGMQGDMAYMARPDRQARRRDLNVILPGVRSIIMVALDYHALRLPDAEPDALTNPARGRIAAYAWGQDYHDVMLVSLQSLAEWLRAASGNQIVQRVYVDTGAVLERSHAQQAGLGFIGKNTMLIHPQRGSYFFLGELLTDMEFDHYDPAHRETMCGSCQRCLMACPTHAFPTPYTLDARRCISYLTIEHKGWIARELRPLMGNWVFGCDICQDVCPFSRFVVPTREPAFIPTDVDRAAPPLMDLLQLDDSGFRARFGGSPIARIGRERMVRNACIAAGNWGHRSALPPLDALLNDASPLVRGHAAWALAQFQGYGFKARLRNHLSHESDPLVRDEIENLTRG